MPETAPETLSLLERKQRLVKHLIEEDIAEDVAKAGVQAAEDSLDYDDIYLWCLDHEFDEEEIDKSCKIFDEEIGKF